MPPRVSLLALALALAVSTGVAGPGGPGAPTGPFRGRHGPAPGRRLEPGGAVGCEPVGATPADRAGLVPGASDRPGTSRAVRAGARPGGCGSRGGSAGGGARPRSGPRPGSRRHRSRPLPAGVFPRHEERAVLATPRSAGPGESRVRGGRRSTIRSGRSRRLSTGNTASGSPRAWRAATSCTSDQIDGYMEDGVALMAEDQAFVAERLAALAPRLPPHAGRHAHRRDGAFDGRHGGHVGLLAFPRVRRLRQPRRTGVGPGRGHPDRRAGERSGQTVPAARLSAVPAVRSLSRGRALSAGMAGPPALLVAGGRHNSASDLPRLRGGAGSDARGGAGGGGHPAGGSRVLSDRAGRGPAPPRPPDSALRLLPGAPAGSCPLAI